MGCAPVPRSPCSPGDDTVSPERRFLGPRMPTAFSALGGLHRSHVLNRVGVYRPYVLNPHVCPPQYQARNGAESKCGSCPGNTSAARNVLSSKSLVIVEDSDQVVLRIRSVADAVAGLEIVGEAADSRSAIELIARHRPDFVILDMQLANGSNGFDVLNYLCDHEPPPQVIVLSANVSEYRSLRRALARADHVLDKMTEFHLLPKALSNSIESGETRKRWPATESAS